MASQHAGYFDPPRNLTMSATPRPQQMIEFAYQLVLAGEKPTADRLRAEFGGSQTTAVQALQAFWTDYLPDRLRAVEVDDPGFPAVLRNALKEIWQAAQDHARAALAEKEARLEAERDALVARAQAAESALAAAQDAAQEEREAMAAALRDHDEELRHLRERTALLQRTVQETEEQAKLASESARREIGALTAERDRLSLAVRALQEERAALSAQHETALARLEALWSARVEELKALHHDAEQRLRVELDAARTQAEKARQAEQRLREGFDGRLEAVQRRYEALLREEREAGDRRLADARSDIRRLERMVQPASPAADPAAQG